MAIDESPLRLAEIAIREALAAPDGDMIGHVLRHYDQSLPEGQRALVAALAGRVKVTDLRKNLRAKRSGSNSKAAA
ncbi:hypothetical protein ACKU27_01035 [Sphingobium yanoikuyae]|uniref:hypothetical protein n=1 Tax=Sphingobium yanoikuyae TaxID=13690 RepID=UPI003B8F469A